MTDDEIQELENAKEESLKGICVYCGATQQYVSLEEKGSDVGNQLRIAHVRACEQRPEKKLIAYVEQLQSALEKYGEHAPHCKSNERYPSPPCDCGFSLAMLEVSVE